MFVIGPKILDFEENLYEVVKTFKEKDNFPIEEFKTHFDCNRVLRKEGKLYFCKSIQEAVIDDTNEPL